MEKLKIRSSHLALRFYVSSGWTEEKVKSYLVSGSLRYFDDSKHFYCESDKGINCKVDPSYWILLVGGVVDTDRLLADVGSVWDFHNKELFGEEARAYINSMNW